MAWSLSPPAISIGVRTPEAGDHRSGADSVRHVRHPRPLSLLRSVKPNASAIALAHLG